MKPCFQYGGMAVIEGVMMRGPENAAVAVRKPNGEIELEKEPVSSIASRYPFLKWPFIRGTFVLIDSMALGIRMLNKSANMSMEEEEEELTPMEMLVTGLLAFALAILLFVILPTMQFIYAGLQGWLPKNLVEGILRLLFPVVRLCNFPYG